MGSNVTAVLAANQMPSLPASLRHLVTLSDPEQMARLTSPDDRRAAARLLPLVGAALTSAPRQWIAAQVTALFASFPMQDLPKEAWRAATLAYVEDLEEYPQDVLIEAIREARRGADTFRPSIKNIRDHADRLVKERREIAARLRMVANVSEPEPAERVRPEVVTRLMDKWRMGEKV
jgi:hypothetical protein